MSGPVDPAETLVVPFKTGLDQRRAADPRASAWVSANAGAGKTKVLTDRVLRLLLAGAPPGRILCLTFTKAAAATMAIRVFERLGQWVALDDERLRTELVKLDGEAPDAERLRLARRLFARAVETPGGLKIETIHAFCERILHMAPFEANVPASFSVLDDGQTEEVLAEATRETLALAASGDVRLRDALERVSVDAAGEALIKVLRDALRWREALLDEAALAATLERLRVALHVKQDEKAASIERDMVEGGIPPAEWPAIIRTLQATAKKTDGDRADALLRAAAAANHAQRLAAYREVFFTGTGTPRSEKLIVTGAVDAALKERLIAEQARLTVLDDRLKAACALERTAALLTLAHEIRARVEIKKARLGALDFDDLIRRTLELLRRDGEAAWILYKLDRGIDHVLVDEAQDTNPAQWEILRRITEDFTAGEGARTVSPRTLFAVGDPKQSIYGFQGAAPAEFESSRRHWETRTRALSLAFEDVRLDLSFRSAKGVLDAVDATFAVAEHFRGLSFEDGVVGTAHTSARSGAPGLVELWPVERPAEEDEPEAWVLPVDEPDRNPPP
jgi:ATP-dependent helicase/nuclease subunit A